MAVLPRLEGLLQRLLRQAAEGRGFLLTCTALALAGTLTAAYPVTAVVVPATLLAASRWRQVAVATAVGSTLGATALVIASHHMGWSALYAHYPQLASHPDWVRVMAWVERYGSLALFAVALSPLPQTPALIFFGVVRPDSLGVVTAVFAGKLLKYGAFAWATRRFPEAFGEGLPRQWQTWRSRRRGPR